MHTIRQTCGLAGFPKREESIHDAFGTGHSSTSISAGLGTCSINAYLTPGARPLTNMFTFLREGVLSHLLLLLGINKIKIKRYIHNNIRI